MEVLLKKDIERLGSKYEVVEVKNGYGRNFLIPKGLAILATDAVKKMHLETIKQRAHKDNQLRDEAAKIYKKMSKKTFQVPAKVGENGKIFSQAFPALSVNPVDVAGAGDSLLALFATGLASGQAMMPTAALACCMAALAVETMGNTPINAAALRSSLQEVLLP